MLLKKIGGRSFIVNLLSDFLINKLGKETSSQICVVDVQNFYIIKGKTSSKEILNLSDVMSEFKNKYEKFLGGIKITHTIDLIEYDFEMKKSNSLTQTFFNTESCSFHQKQIDKHIEDGNTWDFNFITEEINETNFLCVSEFPHGFSMDQSRLLYYYLKKIFYSLPPTYPFTSLTLTISTDDKDFIKVYNNSTESFDEVLESAILDHCDLNLEKFQKDVSEIDFEQELLNPLNEHKILKEEKFGILII